MIDEDHEGNRDGASRMRGPRTTAGAAIVVLASVSLLAGCGGGGSSSSAGGQSGATNGASPKPVSAKPVRVSSVSPKHLTGHGAIHVTFASAITARTPLPKLSPAVAGHWTRSGTTATFTPSHAYPPSTKITVMARRAKGHGHATVLKATTPTGKLLRAQQILARLHYLPLATSAATPTSATEEASAVFRPPHGSFSWRYADTPSGLKSDFSAGKYGEVTRGALIAFQHQAGLTLDGALGPQTWKALEKADLADKTDPQPYSYVSASLYLPQSLSVWVAGKTVLSSPVNGGVASAPTPLGTFPVYERLTSTTMSGTNPDGSHYSDPGVPWVNYFSGGSAVHGFPRASYGSPQSVGCLELPISTAERVFGLINYGTLVTVNGPFVPPPPVAKPSPPGHSASPTPTPKPTPKPTPTKHPTHSPSPHPSPTHSAKH
jgi:peptidoglycan hydrolase-like protein with peptidoglycan-binding domain